VREAENFSQRKCPADVVKAVSSVSRSFTRSVTSSTENSGGAISVREACPFPGQHTVCKCSNPSSAAPTRRMSGFSISAPDHVRQRAQKLTFLAAGKPVRSHARRNPQSDPATNMPVSGSRHIGSDNVLVGLKDSAHQGIEKPAVPAVSTIFLMLAGRLKTLARGEQAPCHRITGIHIQKNRRPFGNPRSSCKSAGRPG